MREFVWWAVTEWARFWWNLVDTFAWYFMEALSGHGRRDGYDRF